MTIQNIPECCMVQNIEDEVQVPGEGENILHLFK